MHIFHDIQPYTCTALTCGEEIKTYRNRGAWIRHEVTHPVPEGPSRICPFCPTSRGVVPSETYYRHVGHHLREIALAVIPQGDENEDEDASDSSQSDSDQKSTYRSDDPSAMSVDQQETRTIPAPATTFPRDVKPKTDPQGMKDIKTAIQPCKYKTGKTIGAGEHSVVKECVHLETGEYYAAKVINKRQMAGREHVVSLSFIIRQILSLGCSHTHFVF